MVGLHAGLKILGPAGYRAARWICGADTGIGTLFIRIVQSGAADYTILAGNFCVRPAARSAEQRRGPVQFAEINSLVVGKSIKSLRENVDVRAARYPVQNAPRGIAESLILVPGDQRVKRRILKLVQVEVVRPRLTVKNPILNWWER